MMMVIIGRRVAQLIRRMHRAYDPVRVGESKGTVSRAASQGGTAGRVRLTLDGLRLPLLWPQFLKLAQATPKQNNPPAVKARAFVIQNSDRRDWAAGRLHLDARSKCIWLHVQNELNHEGS